MANQKVIVSKKDLEWLSEKCKRSREYRGYVWGAIVNWAYCLYFAVDAPSWGMGFSLGLATVIMVHFIARHAKFYFECSNGFEDIFIMMEHYDDKQRS